VKVLLVPASLLPWRTHEIVPLLEEVNLFRASCSHLEEFCPGFDPTSFLPQLPAPQCNHHHQHGGGSCIIINIGVVDVDDSTTKPMLPAVAERNKRFELGSDGRGR
jgi:hypothetical protein